jgi:hypothetical protein
MSVDRFKSIGQVCLQILETMGQLELVGLADDFRTFLLSGAVAGKLDSSALLRIDGERS